MKNHIETNAISIEIIKDILENAAFQPTVDDDGDIYVSRDSLEFGCWVEYKEESKIIHLFTYATVKEGVNQHQMYEFVNMLNKTIIMPQFYATGSAEEGFKLYGAYFMTTLFGVDKRIIIDSLRRFSRAFLSGLRLDEENIYFE